MEGLYLAKKLAAQYTGEEKNGEPHGQGVMVWPDGLRYEGEFQHGQLWG